MIKLINILKEIRVIKKGKVVYAMCTKDGSFEELVLLNNNQIIDDSEEDEWDGTNICKFRDEQGKEDMFYYIDKIEIS